MPRHELNEEERAERRDLELLRSQRRRQFPREERKHDAAVNRNGTTEMQHATISGSPQDGDLLASDGAPGGQPQPVTWLDKAVALIKTGETPVGSAFHDRQAAAYRSVFREAFGATCGCSGHYQEDDPRRACPREAPKSRLTLSEMTRWVQERTGPPDEILQPAQIHLPGPEALHDLRRQCEVVLARPPGHLSLERSERSLPFQVGTIERVWAIDSIWIGATSLEAIQPRNNSFQLSFVPPCMRALVDDHIIQPHGIDLGHTRHTFLGSFNVDGLDISTFLFFPRTNDGGERKKSRYSTAGERASYGLPPERRKELVDQAILPAVRCALPPLLRQEMPGTFDIANAKAKSYQEDPGKNFWQDSDESHLLHLRYTVPGRYLGAFWRELSKRCDQISVSVARQSTGFPYFQNPKLHFQIHDTANAFLQPTVALSLDAFIGSVMESMDPAYLDFRSCWVNIGFRDMPAPQPDAEGRPRPVTLLWKRACMQNFHRQICDASPGMELEPQYYRSYNMRDGGGYASKARATGAYGPDPSNPGNPECTKIGVIHAMAYNCNEELFSGMLSGSKLSGALSLSNLALNDDMVRDVFATVHEADAVSDAPIRERLAREWDARKRRLSAVAQPEMPTNNYAVHKEVTFRLDVILLMHQRGDFKELGTGVGPISAEDATMAGGGNDVEFESESRRHYPFWVLATEEVNAFIVALAGRFIKPLDYLFALGHNGADIVASAKQRGPLLVYYYTAQLFLRLLALSLTSEAERYQDKWIWDQEWRVSKNEGQQRVAYIRRGLGLMSSIQSTGMLWLGADDMDWANGHLCEQKLQQIYIPRDRQTVLGGCGDDFERLTRQAGGVDDGGDDSEGVYHSGTETDDSSVV